MTKNNDLRNNDNKTVYKKINEIANRGRKEESWEKSLNTGGILQEIEDGKI